MFADYVSLCQGLGASELVPRSQEDIKMIIESFEDFSGHCNNKFWVPIRQRGGRYEVKFVHMIFNPATNSTDG